MNRGGKCPTLGGEMSGGELSGGENVQGGKCPYTVAAPFLATPLR